MRPARRKALPTILATARLHVGERDPEVADFLYDHALAALLKVTGDRRRQIAMRHFEALYDHVVKPMADAAGDVIAPNPLDHSGSGPSNDFTPAYSSGGPKP